MEDVEGIQCASASICYLQGLRFTNRTERGEWWHMLRSPISASETRAISETMQRLDRLITHSRETISTLRLFNQDVEIQRTL